MEKVQSKIRVSFIIPAYNQQAYIKECIESVLAQGDQEIEIIVVDDCSTDETAALVKSFGSQVIYIKHDINQGLAASRNTGIKVATGEYVVFLDSDDLLKANFLSTFMQYFENHPAQELAYAFADMIDENGNQLPEICCYCKQGDLLDDLLISNQFPVHSFMIRKAVLEEVGGFNKDLKAAEDWELWMRIANKGYTFGCLGEILVSYRIHSKSMRNFGLHMQKNLEHTIEYIYAMVQTENDLTVSKSKAYYSIYMQTTGIFAFQEQWDMACESLEAADKHFALASQITHFIPELVKNLTPRGYRCIEGIVQWHNDIEKKFFYLINYFAEKQSTFDRTILKKIFAEFDRYMGILLFCERKLPQARKLLWRAFTRKPGLFFDVEFILTLIKAFLIFPVLGLIRGKHS